MITDEQMREELQTAKPYTIVLLRSTARRSETGIDRIIWEHGGGTSNCAPAALSPSCAL